MADALADRGAPTRLFVFETTMDTALRSTFQSRQTHRGPDLAPIAGWIGTSRIDAGRIEVFPVSDLGPVPLSDYVKDAFDPEPPPGTTVRNRLDSIRRSAILVPDTALPPNEWPQPGPQAVLAAELSLAQAAPPRMQAPGTPATDDAANPAPPTAGPARGLRPAAAVLALLAAAALVVLSGLWP